MSADDKTLSKWRMGGHLLGLGLPLLITTSVAAEASRWGKRIPRARPAVSDFVRV